MAPELRPIAYDGGLLVHLNGRLMAGADLSKEDEFLYRYKVAMTSHGRWAVMDDCGCRLSKAADNFLVVHLPSRRPKNFVQDTTWPSPEAALGFLNKWREREKRRFLAYATK